MSDEGPELIVRQLPKRIEGDVALDSLVPFPGNPKDHDIGAIMESIEKNGFADVIRCQEGTRYILGGHGTVKALKALGRSTADMVLWLDCDARTARRLVLAYNRTAELGGFNQMSLVNFLSESARDNNLLGSGYDGEDLDVLSVALNPPDHRGSSGSSGEKPYRTLIVRFRSADDVDAFVSLIGQDVTERTRTLWYPPRGRGHAHAL